MSLVLKILCVFLIYQISWCLKEPRKCLGYLSCAAELQSWSCIFLCGGTVCLGELDEGYFNTVRLRWLMASCLLWCPPASSARHSVRLLPTASTDYIIKAFFPFLFFPFFFLFSPDVQECFLVHLWVHLNTEAIFIFIQLYQNMFALDFGL